MYFIDGLTSVGTQDRNIEHIINVFNIFNVLLLLVQREMTGSVL